MFGYVTALLSPLIALLVAGEVEDCSMVDRIMLGYHNIFYIINASIYLVKGGRLGLMSGVLSICNSLHIELHLTCSIVCCILPCHASLNWTCIILGCASCHVYVVVVYHVVCFFPVVLLIESFGYVAIVRIRSTTPIRLLHGLGLLPSGISSKMTLTLDLTSIVDMLVVSM